MSILRGKVAAIASSDTRPMAATNQKGIGQPWRWPITVAIGTPAATAVATVPAYSGKSAGLMLKNHKQSGWKPLD
ncbi:hypothetical protein, partial [Xanthomonas theicola]|uniref:hypothetical protein n=1 Tax=Xanthomonas theicola TaxID=56464 RepID=UPI0020125F88